MKIWSPDSEYIEKSNLSQYSNFLKENYGLSFENYSQMHQWSIDNLPGFWISMLKFFNVNYEGEYQDVLYQPSQESFIGVRWFEGMKLSYAEHVFKNYSDDRPAIIFKDEENEQREISWRKLKQDTLAIRRYLLSNGVKEGDTVVGVLNNTPETVAIFLAVNSLGAIWSCCSMDFGAESIIERLNQISPKVLFVDKGYSYGGKYFSKNDLIESLIDNITSLEDVLVVNSLKWRAVLAIQNRHEEMKYVRVDFNHPIWILYSSGTTGKPKAIVHSTGGNLLEHLKALAIHQNVKQGQRFMWYTTTGWMMWNYAISSLLLGNTLCIYDGSTSFPSLETIWDFVASNAIDHLGAGAAFYLACQRAQLKIKQNTLSTLGSTGSPLPAETFEWLQNQMPEVHIISLSGGTDVCSAFLTGNPWLDVYAGEIQCKALGVAMEAYIEKEEGVVDEVGELIITKPLPSMPLYFWGDEANEKYFDSYFSKYFGKWCHGDWVKITESQGIVMLGRSDATLNRGGVRIGSAEIYNALADVENLVDSLVITVDLPNGESTMHLFVKLDGDITSELELKIKDTLRKKCSPRHIPDYITQVVDIPYTVNGKKMELPIKRIMMGGSIDKHINLDIVKNPESLNYWKENY